MEFGLVLAAVDAFFESHRLPFALAGAAALSTCGLSRATQDLDFVVPFEVQDALIASLEADGYRTLHRSPGYSNHLHPETGKGRIDFIYVSGETSRRLFEGCRSASFAGRSVRVPRPEHLAAMKVQAMKNDPERRLQDLADIRFLVSLPGVDMAEIRGYFELAEMLSDFDEIQRST